MIRKGTTVGIRGNCTQYPELAGKVGVVTYVPLGKNDRFGVKIYGKSNKFSTYGYFYFPFDQLYEIHIEGLAKGIAAVGLLTKNYNQATSRISSSSLTDKSFPSIKNVYFNNPVTVVIWDDGTKTIVKCQKQMGDTYSKETGLAMCITKKALGNKGNYYDIFKKWIPEIEDEYTNRSCYSCKHRFGEDPECCVNCDRDFSNWDLVD